MDNTFATLPNELILQIVTHLLDVRDIARLSMTNSRLAALIPFGLNKGDVMHIERTGNILVLREDCRVSRRLVKFAQLGVVVYDIIGPILKQEDEPYMREVTLSASRLFIKGDFSAVSYNSQCFWLTAVDGEGRRLEVNYFLGPNEIEIKQSKRKQHYDGLRTTRSMIGQGLHPRVLWVKLTLAIMNVRPNNAIIFTELE